VDEPIAHVLEVELSARSPQIAFTVPVSLEVSVYRSQEEEASDIKFSSSVEQGFLYVFLDNIGPLVSVYFRVIYDFSNTLEVLANLDPTALIGVFSWFHNPKRFSHSLVPFRIEHLCIFQSKYRLEPVELLIRDSFFNMKSERQFFLPLLISGLVESFHIIVKCLFIA